MLNELLCVETVKSYKASGWVFNYDSETRFVGADHPNGGKQIICELKNGFSNDAFGRFIAATLNGIDT